jgi:hypothetical protein
MATIGADRPARAVVAVLVVTGAAWLALAGYAEAAPGQIG